MESNKKNWGTAILEKMGLGRLVRPKCDTVAPAPEITDKSAGVSARVETVLSKHTDDPNAQSVTAKETFFVTDSTSDLLAQEPEYGSDVPATAQPSLPVEIGVGEFVNVPIDPLNFNLKLEPVNDRTIDAGFVMSANEIAIDLRASKNPRALTEIALRNPRIPVRLHAVFLLEQLAKTERDAAVYGLIRIADPNKILSPPKYCIEVQALARETLERLGVNWKRATVLSGFKGMRYIDDKGRLPRP